MSFRGSGGGGGDSRRYDSGRDRDRDRHRGGGGGDYRDRDRDRDSRDRDRDRGGDRDSRGDGRGDGRGRNRSRDRNFAPYRDSHSRDRDRGGGGGGGSRYGGDYHDERPSYPKSSGGSGADGGGRYGGDGYDRSSSRGGGGDRGGGYYGNNDSNEGGGRGGGGDGGYNDRYGPPPSSRDSRDRGGRDRGGGDRDRDRDRSDRDRDSRSYGPSSGGGGPYGRGGGGASSGGGGNAGDYYGGGGSNRNNGPDIVNSGGPNTANSSHYGPSSGGGGGNTSSGGVGGNDYYGGGGGGGDRGGRPHFNDNYGGRGGDTGRYGPSGGGDSGRYGPSGGDRGGDRGDAGRYGPGGGGGGRGDRGGGRGDSRGGGGRGDSRGGGGGGYGRGGGGGRGFGGGRGGGGGGVASHATESVSNLILASISPNFRFFLYGINTSDRKGMVIDTRRRREELFRQGLFDPQQGILSKMDFTKKELESIGRGIFFEGSYCFSSRPIPGLEADKLPMYVVAANQTQSAHCPLSDNGDTLQIMNVQAFFAPKEISDNAAQEVPSYDSELLATLDGSCATCTTSFKNVTALLSHCRETGHLPQTQDVDAKANGSGEVKHASKEVFLSFCNVALQRAMSERMARWGREYIDPKSFQEPSDRRGNVLGVRVFRAYTCEFGMHKPQIDNQDGQVSLTLTVDLRAKIIRTKSVLDSLCEGQDPNTFHFNAQRQNQALKVWRNEIVICKYDKKCYSVIDLLFDHSPASIPVAGLGISHAEYFEKNKGIKLDYPNVRPVLAVLGRHNSTIYFPAELVCGNELEPKLKMQLPSISSFTPRERHDAIEEMKRFLKPGGQKTKGAGGGLLPALGIVLGEERMSVPVRVMALPTIIAAGVRVPERNGKMWAPLLKSANFRVEKGQVVELNVIVVYHRSLSKTFSRVFDRLRDIVNRLNAKYQFSLRPFACVEAGDLERHWGSVENFFRNNPNIPDNVFVLDFSKPANRSSNDPAYSVVKEMLGKAGHLSQFVNFNTYDHGNPKDIKKSSIILQGVARQVLSKCGVRIWWVDVPRSLPLPAIFVGVDVFHAPRKYNPKEKKRTAKESVAAVVVQVVRSYNSDDCPTVELYSETARRDAGKELELGKVLQNALKNAMQVLHVDPQCCIVWRDGVGDATIGQCAEQEVSFIKGAFDKDVSMSYIVCQKRISTKFLSVDGRQGMPVGTLVDTLQGLEHETFYINGTSPPYSTAKPVRYVVAKRDSSLDALSLSELSWALCHDYPNWSGPVKLPAPVQLAHKLAELAGGFVDCGESIDTKSFTNKMHFL